MSTQRRRVNAALTVLTVAGVPGLFRDLETGDRRGELAALAIGVSVGAAASVLARTPWPLLGSVAACLFMLHMQAVRAETDTARQVAPPGAGRRLVR